MSIMWYNEKPRDAVATLYEGNITLNKTASGYIDHAYNVMLGVDQKSMQIVIKPLSKDQVQRGDIPEHKRYKITLRASYGRISNKNFMQEIESLINVKLSEGPRKFAVNWDRNQHLLFVDLKEAL